MIKKINQILIISLQGIGDLLLTTPLLRGLKENLPDAEINVLTLDVNKEVLEGNAFVDNILSFNPRNYFDVIVTLFNIIKRSFDLSICTYPSGLRSAIIGYLSRADTRLAHDITIFRKYPWLFTKNIKVDRIKHAVLLNLDFMEALGFETEKINKDLILNLSSEDRRFARDFLKAKSVKNEDLLICIHAGGGRFTLSYRSWPKERFAEVADFLIERKGAKVVFIGGKDEIKLIDKISNIMKNKPINAVGKMSLKKSAALISECRLLICNNSAPMHIAAALGVPTVSIFGPVDQRIHRPWGEGHIVLQKGLKCSPCYYPFIRDTLEETRKKNRWFGKTFKCLKGNYECTALITVKDVIKAAESILKRI